MFLRLTPEQIKNFDKIKEKNPFVYLNSYLKKEIQKHVNTLEYAFDLDKNGKPATKPDLKPEVKIAVLKLAYKNGSLVRRLKKRGSMIAAANFDGLVEIEDELNDLIQKNK